MFGKYNLQEVVKSPKDPSKSNPKQGNGKEAKSESVDKSDQKNPAEGKNNQQVIPENNEELGQTKPMSDPQLVMRAEPNLNLQVKSQKDPNQMEMTSPRKSFGVGGGFLNWGSTRCCWGST
uniref:Macaca fascicularis brain cDNA clone: QflA-21546, similar to human hypothetical protein FLJ20274 (FLJ20274), mRNA, RefSeq: NM_017736.2 n=1 Tax=Macaca fascicularis TaxID=9541 RepID=I7G6Y3_MACFA|nr:unnamed protein product [Macaca fascicularis]